MDLDQALHNMAWGTMTLKELAGFQDALWEQGVDHILKQARPVQEKITKSVAQRGYGPGGLAPAAYAAKQMCKAVEEIAELASCFRLPEYLARSISVTGAIARHYFDDQEVWTRTSLDDEKSSAAELADVLIPLLVCATALDIDALDEAEKKASADIQRGVRGEKAAAP